MSQSPHTIMLTLRSIDGQDPLGERVIRLGPGDHIPVGRSSKNQSKGIMARKDNAYIDSPVVSREHAVFTAELSRYDTPMVFLKDKGSMHGTKVNSMPLKSNEKYTLRNGDELEIGSHVVRDRDSFPARRYKFHSEYARPDTDRAEVYSLFPRGVSVPSSSGSSYDDEPELYDEEERRVLDECESLVYDSQSYPDGLEDRDIDDDSAQSHTDFPQEENEGPRAAMHATIQDAFKAFQKGPGSPIISLSNASKSSPAASAPAGPYAMQSTDCDSSDESSIGSDGVDTEYDLDGADADVNASQCETDLDSDASIPDDEEDTRNGKGPLTVRRLPGLGAVLNHDQQKTTVGQHGMAIVPTVSASPIPSPGKNKPVDSGTKVAKPSFATASGSMHSFSPVELPAAKADVDIQPTASPPPALYKPLSVPPAGIYYPSAEFLQGLQGPEWYPVECLEDRFFNPMNSDPWFQPRESAHHSRLPEDQSSGSNLPTPSPFIQSVMSQVAQTVDTAVSNSQAAVTTSSDPSRTFSVVADSKDARASSTRPVSRTKNLSIAEIVEENPHKEAHPESLAQVTSAMQDESRSTLGQKQSAEHKQISIPEDLVGMVIGPSGSTFRELQLSSGCNVTIAPHSESVDGLRPVYLMGSSECVLRASEFIRHIIEKNGVLYTAAPATAGSKRKADVLDAEEDVLDPEEDVIKSERVEETTVQVVTESPAPVPVAQRPRKKLRRALNLVSTVAAGVAFGAIAVVGGLTALPEGFFE